MLKCKLVGKLVTPCKFLKSVVDNSGINKAKGIHEWSYSDNNGTPTRVLIGVKSKNHKNGLIFNFCPFCGELIKQQEK